MRRLTVLILISVTLAGGCAPSTEMTGVRLPEGDAAERVHDWDVLRAIDGGSRVVVIADPTEWHAGKLDRVSTADLTLEGRPPIPRASVVRVVRVESLSGIHAKQGMLIGMFLGGVVLVASGGFALPLVVDPPLCAGIGALSGVGQSRQTLVYERR
jgi:hypothetical protein